jgi:hypothetical protein
MIRSNRKTSLKYPIIVILLFTVSLLIYSPIIPKAHAETPRGTGVTYCHKQQQSYPWTAPIPCISDSPITPTTNTGDSIVVTVGYYLPARSATYCPTTITVNDTIGTVYTAESSTFTCDYQAGNGGEMFVGTAPITSTTDIVTSIVSGGTQYGTEMGAIALNSSISVIHTYVNSTNLQSAEITPPISFTSGAVISGVITSSTLIFSYDYPACTTFIGTYNEQTLYDQAGNFGNPYGFTCVLSGSGVTSTSIPVTISSSTGILIMALLTGVSTITQPIQCTTSPNSMVANVSLSVSSGIISPHSWILCNNTPYNYTVSPAIIITASTPSDSTYTRYRFDSSSTPTTEITTLSNASQWNIELYYQTLNSYNLIPVSPTSWDNSYSESIIGTSVGVISTQLATISLTSGGSATAQNAWSDYNTQTIISPIPFGLWNTPSQYSFTPLSGSNVYSMNFYLGSNVINTTTITITYTNPSGQTGDFNAGINQLVTEMALLVPALLIMGAMLYTAYELGMRTVGRMGIIFELTLLGVTAIGFVPLWLGTIVFIIAIYVIITQRNETIGDKE